MRSFKLERGFRNPIFYIWNEEHATLNVVSHTLLILRKTIITVNRNEKAPLKHGIPVLFQNNGFPGYKNITSSFSHSTFHATIYLFNLMSCYSDIIQSSKLDIHRNTLSLAHMDSFWFVKVSAALIRMRFMPYYVYVAVDIKKVAMFQHWNSTLFFDLLLWREDSKLITEVLLQDYMLLKGKPLLLWEANVRLFHWN